MFSCRGHGALCDCVGAAVYALVDTPKPSVEPRRAPGSASTTASGTGAATMAGDDVDSSCGAASSKWRPASLTDCERLPRGERLTRTLGREIRMDMLCGLGGVSAASAAWKELSADGTASAAPAGAAATTGAGDATAGAAVAAVGDRACDVDASTSAGAAIVCACSSAIRCGTRGCEGAWATSGADGTAQRTLDGVCTIADAPGAPAPCVCARMAAMSACWSNPATAPPPAATAEMASIHDAARAVPLAWVVVATRAALDAASYMRPPVRIGDKERDAKRAWDADSTMTLLPGTAGIAAVTVVAATDEVADAAPPLAAASATAASAAEATVDACVSVTTSSATAGDATAGCAVASSVAEATGGVVGTGGRTTAAVRMMGA